MTPTVGSLFSGIGGLDLGLERAGFQVRWQAENDPYASRVLAKHWPHVPNLGDVTAIDWSKHERVDVVAGGFPCQPVSVAGRGLAQSDARWLWPSFADCLRLLRPAHVLVENVPGLTVRGMGDVLGDLAALGYDCEWQGIPASAFGAPHLRWRVFIVAHHSDPYVSGSSDGLRPGREGTRTCRFRSAERLGPNVAHAESDRREHAMSSRASRVVGTMPERRGTELAYPDGAPRDATRSAGETVFRSSPVRRSGRRSSSSGEGWGTHWATEPDVGRMANGIPDRVDRLRTLGNAVVPQVAEWIGQQLLAHLTED